MAGDKISQKISDLYEHIEGLKMKGIADPETAAEVLSDALEELQASLEELTVADEELCQQNEELILTQSKLQESEEKYRELVENANSIIIRMDKAGKISFFNEYAQMFFGYSSDEILGRDVKILVPPVESSSGRSLEEMTDDILRSPDDFIENINENVRKDGERVWISWRNKAIRGARGDIAGNLAIGQDITKRKQAEMALRESEEKYRLLFESMGEGFLLVEMILDDCGKPISYRYLDANPALEKLTHLKRGDIIGRDVREVLPGVEPYWIEAFGQVAMSGRPLHIEQFSEDLSGWYDVYIFCPKPGQAALIYTNTTGRKRAEVALQESVSRAEQRSNELNAALSSIAAGVIIYDKSGKIVRINDMALNMLGISSADLDPENYSKRKARIGTSKPDGTPLKTEEAPYYRALHGESILREEVVFELQDRERLWVSTTASPIQNSKGEISGAIAIFTDITDRKLAEEKLRQSEEKHRRLFTTITEGFALAEIIQDNHGKPIDYRFLEINPAFEKLTGITGEAAEGKTIRELVPDIKPSWIETYGKVALTGEPINFIDQSRSSGKWYETYAYSPAKGKFGLIFSDVTERKKAEEALRESEERYRSLFNSMTEGFALHEIICDDKGEPCDFRFLDINPAFERLTGLNKADVIGRTHNKVLPDDDPRWIREYGAVALTGKSIQFDSYSPALKRHYEVFAYCPAPRQFAVVFMDITERKQADEAVAAAHRQIQSIIDNTPAIVYAFDLEERFVMANIAIAKLFNSTPEEMIGKRRHEFMPGEDADWHEANDRQVIEAGRAQEFEEYSQLKDRSITWLTTKFPLCDAHGRVYAVAGISADITERKRAEEELQKAHDELELRVQERTAELSQSKEGLEVINEELQVELDEHQRLESELIMAKDLALEAVEAKAAFLANMSHELRTPMNAVIGFSSLLMDDALTPDQKDYIERIRVGGEVLLSLINDILDFSKMEKKKVELEHQTLSLRSLVEESLSMVAVQARDKGLNLAYTINYGTPDAIIGDLGRLRQVLLNLLSNAVKFTNNGDVSISISSKVR